MEGGKIPATVRENMNWGGCQDYRWLERIFFHRFNLFEALGECLGLAKGRRACDPSGVGDVFRRVPVVSLADSLNHRLMDWQASGLHEVEAEHRESVPSILVASRLRMNRTYRTDGTDGGVMNFSARG
jgi:hypothetical protein